MHLHTSTLQRLLKALFTSQPAANENRFALVKADMWSLGLVQAAWHTAGFVFTPKVC